MTLLLAACLVLLIAKPASAACDNEDLRKGVGSLLPDCRAYEQVSPTEKSGFDVGVTGSLPAIADRGGPASADGSAVAFVTSGPFAGSRWGGTGVLAYVSRRDGGGWQTSPLFPPPLVFNGLFGQRVAAFSADMTSSFIWSARSLDANPAASSNNYYFQDNLTGALVLASGSSGSGQSLEASSSDLSHFSFTASEQLTSDVGQPASGNRVYEFTGGGLRLVARQPGSDAPFSVTSNLGGQNTGVEASMAGAVSETGQHIFFTAPHNSSTLSEIYRRSNGMTTVLASASKRSAPDPTARAKIFHVATDDGNRVFFRSRQQLTDDANDSVTGSTGDLYRYDFDADQLIDLSAGTTGLTPANVRGVLDISDDGDRAYFTASGQVVPGEGDPSTSLPKLYLWEDDGTVQGSVRFIATLDSSSSGLADSLNWDWGSKKVAQTTSSGSHLVFQSRANVVGYAPAGTSQVYVYSAEANGGAGQLACVSCGPGASPPAGTSFVPSFLTVQNFGGTNVLGVVHPRVVSGGGRVVFTTPNRLLPQDVNGELDAYLWDGGQLSLLSTGTEGDASYAHAISEGGGDAFLRTRESLVGQDGDTLIDLYTARVGGGFVSQQAEPAVGCAGEGCQGPSTPAPPVIDPRSAEESDLGNVRPAADCGRFTRAAKRLTRRARGLRRKARQASGRRPAARLQRRAGRLSKQAKRQQARARQCRQRGRGAGK